jgi:hypothetical protein
MLQPETKQQVVQLKPVEIRTGIYHGDSLLPLLLCIALIPLTHEVNSADCGCRVHRTERKINRSLYVEGSKLLGRNEEIWKIKQKKIVKAISNDINRKSGLETCAKICLKR